jgi:hypothetical protein
MMRAVFSLQTTQVGIFPFRKKMLIVQKSKKERRKYPPLSFTVGLAALVICVLFILLWEEVGSSCSPVVLYELFAVM